jgi:hypothetical protein
MFDEQKDCRLPSFWQEVGQNKTLMYAWLSKHVFALVLGLDGWNGSTSFFLG